MKRCPKCSSGFPDSFEFCERDGTVLVTNFSGNYSESSESGTPEAVDDYDELMEKPASGIASSQSIEPHGLLPAGRYQVSAETQLRQNLKLLTLMIVGGVVIGLVLLLAYQLLRGGREATNENSNEKVATGNLKQQPMPVMPLRSSTPNDDLASPEPSPSPSASPSPSPATQLDSAPPAISSGMVSTGGEDKSGRGPFTIHLTNGNSVEADDVWQTADGIWYRRHGVATLLERKEVKGIEKLEEKKSSTSASPAPTPSPAKVVSP